MLLFFCAVNATAATEGIYTYSVSNKQATITDCDTSASGEIVIPDTLGGYPVTSIGDSAFYGCSELVSITIPDSVTSIGDWAFYNCDSLESITIPDSVTSIGDSAFNDCSSLISVTIPDSVTSIGDYAFYNCDSLESITIPGSVTSVGNSAFSGCDSLMSVTIGDGVTSIGSWAFLVCDSLERVDITDLSAWCEISFEDYEANPLHKAGNLYLNGELVTDFVIPDDVTSIGNYTFYNCDSLESITIPDSVTSIGDKAFYNCDSLTNVYYNGTEDDWNKISIGSNNTSIANATKHNFSYITLLDKTGVEISKTTQAIGEFVDTSAVIIPDGYEMFLYTDKSLSTFFDISTPINENLTLYVDLIKLNMLEFEEGTTNDIGEKGISQKLSFATDNEAKYFSCTLKVPESLEVQEIKSDIFEIEQDSEVIGNDTYYYLFLIYNGDGNIPTYKPLNAFEIEFDVSENAVAGAILTIEILNDAILADDDGNSYEFESIGKAEIKITPVLAKEITIIGADEIDMPTQYTVSVFPENTTNSNVEWSLSDETIATISADGIVTPVKNGTVIIRATAQDESGIYAEKTVSVKVLGTVNSITTNIGIWDKEYSPDITNYTIYVPENTTSIKLTAKHNGTFKTDTTTFVNNVARTVTLSTTSDETVLDLSYTCDGYDDNTYIITIIKFEGTKTEVSEDGKSFTITPINIETGKNVILALYNGEQFVEMQSAVYNGEAITFTTTKTYTKAKVFVWNDLTTLSPVCETEAVK